MRVFDFVAILVASMSATGAVKTVTIHIDPYPNPPFPPSFQVSTSDDATLQDIMDQAQAQKPPQMTYKADYNNQVTTVDGKVAEANNVWAIASQTAGSDNWTRVGPINTYSPSDKEFIRFRYQIRNFEDLDEHLDVKYSAGTKAWCSYMIIVTSVFFSFSIA